MSSFQILRHWFLLLWRPSHRVMWVIVVLSLVSAFQLLAFPLVWQRLLDAVGSGATVAEMNRFALWLVALGLSHFVLYVLLMGLRAYFNAKLSWRARRVVFNHVTKTEPAFHRRWEAGDLVTRLTDDAGEKTSWLLSSGVFRNLEALFIVSTCLIAMFWIDASLSLWVVIPLPLLFGLQLIAQRKLARRYRDVQASISKINEELTATFSGIRIVQACGLEQAASQRFQERSATQRSAEIKVAQAQHAVHVLFGYGWQFAIVALLVAGGLRVIDGDLSLGQYVAFEGFVMTMTWPMFDFGIFVSRSRQAAVALTRLQAIVDEPEAEITTSTGRIETADVELRSLCTHSAGGEALLKNVSLTVAAGEHVAVVGAVGCGKSVLLQVLAGQRDVQQGELFLGNEAIENLAAESRARAVAFVPQDPVLISSTLRDNIMLGRECSVEHLDEALSVSRLAQDLEAFPEGLDTIVGERGLTLSGGQQQRVALARALVGSPRILLLDDATAALDADTEAAFWAGLEERCPGLSAIVVTHRVPTLENADSVVFMEKGCVAARGKHVDLLKSTPAYAALYGAGSRT